MTRKEAIRKIKNIGRGIDSTAEFLDKLEALGIINFEEEKLTPVDIIRTYLQYPEQEQAQQIIDALREAGYMIVPKHPTC